jgi:hypothetical protein
MEHWRAVVNYEGLYEVSDLGNVRSVKNGRCRPVVALPYRWGYLRVQLYKDGKPKKHNVHRIVLRAFKGVDPLEVDHKDLNKANNSLKNLRPSTRLRNARHRSPVYHNKSGVCGVNWYQKPGRSGKWRAFIIVEGKYKTLGFFDSIEEAAKARKSAERKRDGS